MDGNSDYLQQEKLKEAAVSKTLDFSPLWNQGKTIQPNSQPIFVCRSSASLAKRIAVYVGQRQYFGSHLSAYPQNN
jgi:hypothetical protein